ncbi:MAG: hypothetical protein VKQ33_15670 [Candidatus Sericytochromatia bacterium]|nr:hypothetical protein [Candidatus Sericytochromatia bacterium]
MTAVTPPFSLHRAEAFVEAAGTPLERSLWKAGFGCGPVEVLVFELEAHLDAQGVWRGLGENEPPGGLASAVAALRLLSTVNLGEDIFEVGARTVAQLARRRSADGSWDAPGPWPGGGDGIGRRAWYTAAIGALVGGLTGSAPAAEVRRMEEGAARWLEDHWRRLPDPGPALCWLTLACVGSSRSDAARHLVADAEARLAHWCAVPRPAADLAWLHAALRGGGRPAEDGLRRLAWEWLVETQLPDGSWAGESDVGWPVSAVEATYHACRALVRP